MKKILLIISLFTGLFSYSQAEHLLWLEGRITQSKTDKVTCDIYMYDRASEDWMYMITYEYGDTYAVSFDYQEYYILVFKDSHHRYELHVPIIDKAFQIVDIGLDADTKAILSSTTGVKGYTLKLLE
jgi:hypothetical protein